MFEVRSVLSKPLEKTLGIIGGGQLGKMMIQEAVKLGIQTVILDPTEKCPAHTVADEHIQASFHDKEAIRGLVKKCDVCTYEFEHIDTEELIKLETLGYKIYPQPTILKVIQDKYQQKEFLKARGIPLPRYIKINGIEDIDKAKELFGLPLMLKACQGGYDGKGNALIKTEEDIKSAYEALGNGQIALMAEEYIPFEKEVSAIVARNKRGELASFPIAENDHHESILRETTMPAQITEAVTKEVEELGKTVVDAFSGIGLFCIEFFVTKEGRVLLNEIAPRPHNSGHVTIEICETNQFQQHLRSVMDLPLGSTRQNQVGTMINLIGETDGTASYEGVEELLEIDGAHLHVYGKKDVKKGRKMGHMTFTGATSTVTREKAQQGSAILEIKGLPHEGGTGCNH